MRRDAGRLESVGTCGPGLSRFVSAGVVLGTDLVYLSATVRGCGELARFAQAVSSTPTPDAAWPVHAAQMWIDSASMLCSMSSGSGISACGSVDGAADGVRCGLPAEGCWPGREVSGEAVGPLPCLGYCAQRVLTGWSEAVCSAPVELCQHPLADQDRDREDPLSIGCCDRQREVAQRRVMRASMCRSSPVSPITDGINSASRGRPSSEVWSLTRRATDASNECVHAG